MKTLAISNLPIRAVMVLVVSLSIISCEKDKGISKSGKLTDGNWKMSAFTVDPAVDWFGNTITNIYAQLPACDKDDLSIFKIDGTLLFDEGASKCDPANPQTRTAKWVMNPAETTITITETSETTSWDIITLDQNTLSAAYKVVDNNTVFSFNISFRKVQ